MTMIITGLGSVLTAVVDNYAWFVAARTITGIGIGADLAIVNTYINEMAPRHGRARYTALIFLFSALGAVLGILLGLWLTTPATPLPMGLPFAIAGPGFEYGWRIMYLIGGALALIGVLLCFQLPESARWLIARGRLQQAAAVIDMMEHRASAAYRWRPLSAPSSLVSATCKRPLHRDPRRPNVSRTHDRAVRGVHHGVFLWRWLHDHSGLAALPTTHSRSHRRRWYVRLRAPCGRRLRLCSLYRVRLKSVTETIWPVSLPRSVG